MILVFDEQGENVTSYASLLPPGLSPMARPHSRGSDAKGGIDLEGEWEVNIKDLYKDLLGEFGTYFDHIHSLDFDEEPKYSYLRKIFRDHFVREGFDYDHVFDWTILEYVRTTKQNCQKNLPKIVFRITTKANGSCGHRNTVCVKKEKAGVSENTDGKLYPGPMCGFRASDFILSFAGDVVRCCRPLTRMTELVPWWIQEVLRSKLRLVP